MRTTSLALALAVCLAPAAAAQTILYTFDETEAQAEAGRAVAIWTDLNGDGHAEWAVGAPGQDSNGVDAGRVTVFSGIDNSVYHVFDGAVAGGRFGQSMANAGDVNLDGVDDLAVGASEARTVTVYSGMDLSVIWTFALPGHVSFGYSVAGAGDMDGDGYGDVIVGAPFMDSQSGRVYVYSGQTGTLLFQHMDASRRDLGWSVAGVGDVNDDGFDDVVAGAPYTGTDLAGNGGAVVVLIGPSGAVDFLHAPSTFEERGMEFGFSVAPAGDIDGDGYDDYAVGARWYGWIHYVDDNWAGVFSGRTHAELWRATGPPDSWFGYSTASAGDVDLDGFQDLMVGDPGMSRVHVYSPARDEELFYVDGGLPELYGTSVAGGGDVNDDGFPDLVLGAAMNGAETAESGKAVLFTWGCWDAAAYNYCDAVANTSGSPAVMGWGGSTSVATNNFRLTASQLPLGPTHTGIFIVSADADQTPLGNGNLCLGTQTLGFIVRLPGFAADFQGAASVFLDLTSTAFFGFQATPGSTWFFQAWFRDFVGAGFNFSDGLRVTFCP